MSDLYSFSMKVDCHAVLVSLGTLSSWFIADFAQCHSDKMNKKLKMLNFHWYSVGKSDSSFVKEWVRTQSFILQHLAFLLCSRTSYTWTMDVLWKLAEELAVWKDSRQEEFVDDQDHTKSLSGHWSSSDGQKLPLFHLQVSKRYWLI